MYGKDIKLQLKSLIKQATLLDSDLAQRLREINRWIKDLKGGSLTAKQLVSAFLLQIIADSRVLLSIKALPTLEEQQAVFANMTPTARYWYQELFPRWLQHNDPKFYIWKQKLMSGQFNQNDAEIIRILSQQVIKRGGTAWQRYIADLSMATDLIISYNQSNPLCLQITSLSTEFSQEKYQQWQRTLHDWGIVRGLFLSYNPGDANFLNYLINLATYNSDHLKEGNALKFP